MDPRSINNPGQPIVECYTSPRLWFAGPRPPADAHVRFPHDCSSPINCFGRIAASFFLDVADGAIPGAVHMGFSFDTESMAIDLINERGERYGIGHRKDQFGAEFCACSDTIDLLIETMNRVPHCVPAPPEYQQHQLQEV